MYKIAIFVKKKNTAELRDTKNVTIRVQTIQKLKNKDYGQEKNDEECRENYGSDENGLPLYTFQVAGNNSIRYDRIVYGYTGLDSGQESESIPM